MILLKGMKGYFTEDGRKLCFIGFQGEKEGNKRKWKHQGFEVDKEELAVELGTREVQLPRSQLLK